MAPKIGRPELRWRLLNKSIEKHNTVPMNFMNENLVFLTMENAYDEDLPEFGIKLNVSPVNGVFRK